MSPARRRRAKIFLAFELGGRRAKMVEKVFASVFRDWDRETGALAVSDIDSEFTHQQVRALLRGRCGLFDLTGEKRRKDNGINLNVLLEMGISLGLGRPTFAIYSSNAITRSEIERRIADIKGCSIYDYKDKKSLVELMTRLRLGYLKKLHRR